MSCGGCHLGFPIGKRQPMFESISFKGVDLLFFWSDMKFKMADTTGLSLTLDPMGTMFQNASSLKPLGQLKPNCPGMIIGMSFAKLLFFYADRKSKMAATAGHSLHSCTVWL
jgi:hypothetical protein